MLYQEPKGKLQNMNKERNKDTEQTCTHKQTTKQATLYQLENDKKSISAITPKIIWRENIQD